jgi:hypothetical protein
MRLSAVAGTAFVLAAMLVGAPATAQRSDTVADVTVRYGVVKALQAEHVDAQHGTHKGAHGSGMQHLVVALAKAGAHLAGAKVVVELRDPKGGVQKKPLQAIITSGFPDYSEVFYFGWSGTYRIRVWFMLEDAVRPLEARFAYRHVI